MKSRDKAEGFHLSVLSDVFKKSDWSFNDKKHTMFGRRDKKGLKNECRSDK